MARANLAALHCPRCKGNTLLSDGTAGGRLRIKCGQCKRSLYAQVMTEQLQRLKLLPPPTREPAQRSLFARGNLDNSTPRPSLYVPAGQTQKHVQSEERRAITNTSKLPFDPVHESRPQNSAAIAEMAILPSSPSTRALCHAPRPQHAQYKQPQALDAPPKSQTKENCAPHPTYDENSHERLTDEPDDDTDEPDDISMQGVEDRMLIADTIQELVETRNLHEDMIQRQQRTITRMEEKLKDIHETLQRLIQLQTSLEHPNSMPMITVPGTGTMEMNEPRKQPGWQARNLVLEFDIPRTADQGPISYLQAASSYQPPDSAWKVVTKRGPPRAQMQQAAQLGYETLASQSRYEALREAIPSLDRTTARREAEWKRQDMATRRAPQVLSPEQLERVKNGHPAMGTSPMVTLHFQGIKRTRYRDIKDLLFTVGIRPSSIRNISFIGKRVMELVTFEDVKEDCARRLATIGVTLEANFDPLSPSNIKNEKIMPASLSQEGREALAKKLYENRVQKALERIPKTPINNRLRNFLRSHLKGTNKTIAPETHERVTQIDGNQEELDHRCPPEATEAGSTRPPEDIEPSDMSIDSSLNKRKRDDEQESLTQLAPTQ